MNKYSVWAWVAIAIGTTIAVAMLMYPTKSAGAVTDLQMVVPSLLKIEQEKYQKNATTTETKKAEVTTSATVVSSTTLTKAQINAIEMLLIAFGADRATVASVITALKAQ